MLSKKKIELLAPAGDMECLRAAIKGGADAIYIGGKSFGARALAKNFDHDEMVEAIKLAHLHDVKIYVTINTMLYEPEIDNALKEIGFLYDCDVDGLIVSDLGLIDAIRQIYPDIEIHVSTQAHIHNIASCKEMMAQNVHRVVLARELDLDEIKAISALDIETEVFVHGAICISYSGQCLMGSVLHQRSGNRGVCSQCCRMRYRLYDEDKKSFIDTKGDYLLSPKDLFLLDEVPKIIEAGVSSIKIEGRMKRPEYVALVTRMYRLAIDAYYRHEKFEVTEEIVEDLKLLFNRDFTSGHFLKAKGSDLMNPLKPNHIGIKVGEVIDQKRGRIYIRFTKDITQGDGLKIVDHDREYGLVANKIYKRDLLVNSAKAKEIASFDYRDKIQKGASVYKTTSIELEKRINGMEDIKKIPIKINYIAKVGMPFVVMLNDGQHEVKVEGPNVEKAKNRPMTVEDINKQLTKLNNTVYSIEDIKGDIDEPFIPVSMINDTRRKAIALLDEVRITPKERKRGIYKPYDLIAFDLPHYIFEIADLKQYQTIKNFKKLEALYITSDLSLAKDHDDILYLPSNINEGSEYKDIRQVTSEIGGLSLGEIGYMTLNVANTKTVAYLLSKGLKGIILSSEINDEMAIRLYDGFEKVYGFRPPLYLYTYGKRDLMYLKRDPVYKELGHIDLDHHFSLVDLKKESFHIVKDKDKTRLIESKTTLLQRPKAFGRFVRFYDEGIGKVNEIVYRLLQDDESSTN